MVVMICIVISIDLTFNSATSAGGTALPPRRIISKQVKSHSSRSPGLMKVIIIVGLTIVYDGCKKKDIKTIIGA